MGMAPAKVVLNGGTTLAGGPTLSGAAPVMAVNRTVIQEAAPANFAIPVPQLRGGTTLTGGTTLAEATPVMAFK